MELKDIDRLLLFLAPCLVLRLQWACFGELVGRLGLLMILSIYIYPPGERWPQQTDAAAPDARVGEVLPEPVRRLLAAALARRHPLLPGLRHPGRHLRGAA